RMIRTCLLLTLLALALTAQQTTHAPAGNGTEEHKGGVAGFFEGIKNGVVTTWNKAKHMFDHDFEQAKNETALANQTVGKAEAFVVNRMAELKNTTEQLKTAVEKHI
ncbi:hypothetical protein PMAYCL1PPCAC_03263, partial [Pristionchus mayeri]